jgi:hypothetical protein
MSRSLCQRERLLRDDFRSYCRLVADPRFVCRHCGRAARKKKYLCDPKVMHLADEAKTA